MSPQTPPVIYLTESWPLVSPKIITQITGMHLYCACTISHLLPGRRFTSVRVICFVDSCDMILICNLLSVINSCFLTALVVRFLTRRFIWEYDPTLGECQSVAVPSQMFWPFASFSVIVTGHAYTRIHTRG